MCVRVSMSVYMYVEARDQYQVSSSFALCMYVCMYLFPHVYMKFLADLEPLFLERAGLELTDLSLSLLSTSHLIFFFFFFKVALSLILEWDHQFN